MSSVDERSCCTEQVSARQGAGFQRIQVVQEVTDDLIHQLLGQTLPSGAGKSLGNIIDLVSYVAWCEIGPQVGGKYCGGVLSVVEGTDGSSCPTLTGGLHSWFKVVAGDGVVIVFDQVHHCICEVKVPHEHEGAVGCWCGSKMIGE